METKFKLRLGGVDNLEELKTVVINAISFEFLVDLVSDTIRHYQMTSNLSELTNEFSKLVENGRNVSFSNFTDWSFNKTNTFDRLLKLVKNLDSSLAEQEQCTAGQVSGDIQTKLMAFLISLNSVTITEDLLDIGDVKIEEFIIKNALEELSLVNEGKILSTFISMSYDMTPLDNSGRNSIIEKKISQLSKIINNCEAIFSNDLEKINDKVLSLYDKFYKVAYDSLTDSEKTEKARKLVKSINPHRQLLDKLENKLSEANELRRQLIIHEKRLNEELENQKTVAKDRVAEDPSKKDIIEHELDSSIYLTDTYINQIDSIGESLDQLKEKIAEHFNVLDRLENALKSAIPTEEEMKKYSAVSFKLQELIVRLENAKSQVSKEDSEVKTLIDTAVAGLTTMIAYAIDIKELFMRNSLMSASFKAVNSLYDFTNGLDKYTELTQIKDMTVNLSKYSEVYTEFSSKLVEFRELGNNTIRDLSITMGKAINGVNLLEIIGIIDERIQLVQAINNTLIENNEKQYEILNEIMNI